MSVMDLDVVHEPRLKLRADFFSSLLKLYAQLNITDFGLFPREKGRVGSIIIEYPVQAIEIFIDKMFNLPDEQPPFGVLQVKDALAILKNVDGEVLYDFSKHQGAIHVGEEVYTFKSQEIVEFSLLKTYQPDAFVNVSIDQLLSTLRKVKDLANFSYDGSKLHVNGERIRAEGSGSFSGHTFKTTWLRPFLTRLSRLHPTTVRLGFKTFSDERRFGPLVVECIIGDFTIRYFLAPYIL